MASNYVSEYRGFNIVKVDNGARVVFHANGVPAGDYLASYPEAIAVVDSWIERRDCKHDEEDRDHSEFHEWCGFCGEDM